MSFKLIANQTNLIDLFNGESEFEIPDFQRSYSWEYKECTQLYSDVFEMFHKKEEFFLGNIITAKSDEEADKVQVVDGQQRLTTLLLWIKALELIYKEQFESNHGGLHKSLYKEDWESTQTITRLKSTVLETNDNENFQKIVAEKFNVTDADKLLEECSKDNKIIEKKCNNNFIRSFVYFYKWSKNDFIFDLKDFILYFLKKVVLLPMRLEADTKDEAINKALVIFETINNRGKILEDSDIFKSKLHLLALKKGEKDLFISRWIELREQVDNLGLKIDDIFKFYSHIIRGREKITSNTISLRAFFTLKPYSPLKNNEHGYDLILNELYQIVEINIFINDILSMKIELTKWFQLINIYTNQYPKIALVVYLYKLIEEGLNLEEFKNNLVDNKQSNIKKEVELFSQKIIRYIYYKGATTTIRTEIYNIIKQIMWNQEIAQYYNKVDIGYFENLGKLKNGYALLNYYLSNNEIVNNMKFYKIITYKDKKLNEENSDLYSKLGNIKVLDTGIRIKLQNDFFKDQDNINYVLEHDEIYKKNIINFIKGNS